MTTQPNISISIQHQTLELHAHGAVLASYPISSARNGIGFEPGSLCTPIGRFIVSEKIGGNAPVNTIFKSRIAIDIWDPCQAPSDDDLITTRILWLAGIDPQNANTKERFIYIHGTNHEDEIGTPASCGCIRMKNTDIIELFDKTPIETSVFIHEI